MNYTLWSSSVSDELYIIRSSSVSEMGRALKEHWVKRNESNICHLSPASLGHHLDFSHRMQSSIEKKAVLHCSVDPKSWCLTVGFVH